MEIRAVDGDFLANRISGLADGMAQYVRNRRPVGTRKEVMAAWRLSPEEARTIVEGRASKATVERVFHKSRGGWSVSLAVIGAVVGERLDEHLSRERKAHEEQAARMAALARDLRGGPGPSDRPSGSVGDRPPERREFVDRRGSTRPD